MLKCVSKLNLCVQDVSHFSSPLIIKAVCRTMMITVSQTNRSFSIAVFPDPHDPHRRGSQSQTLKHQTGLWAAVKILFSVWCDVFDRSQDLRPIWAISCSYTVHAIAAIMVLLRERGTAPRKKPTNPWSWQTNIETAVLSYYSFFFFISFYFNILVLVILFWFLLLLLSFWLDFIFKLLIQCKVCHLRSKRTVYLSSKTELETSMLPCKCIAPHLMSSWKRLDSLEREFSPHLPAGSRQRPGRQPEHRSWS